MDTQSLNWHVLPDYWQSCPPSLRDEVNRSRGLNRTDRKESHKSRFSLPDLNGFKRQMLTFAKERL
jgi:hypothetical protein